MAMTEQKYQEFLIKIPQQLVTNNPSMEADAETTETENKLAPSDAF